MYNLNKHHQTNKPEYNNDNKVDYSAVMLMFSKHSAAEGNVMQFINHIL